ncbi:hypothetical protein PR002_g15271 [Phytophthora rubi]|uniref:Uncharacterized protein n=1 Tax=Phytophthora rubi TaxID=129364 RepID=A0A6A3KV12_9STRA|nr:hypothetical protein PR002_g15271 [Phytophthora rubi]
MSPSSLSSLSSSSTHRSFCLLAASCVLRRVFGAGSADASFLICLRPRPRCR